MTILQRISARSILFVSGLLASAPALAQTPPAAGDGLEPPCIPGLPCNAPTGTGAAPLIDVIGKILAFILDLLGIIAVVFIIIAGIRLIVSQGEEEQKEKAKKTILYVIIGLIVILLARVLVGFVVGEIPGLFGLS